MIIHPAEFTTELPLLFISFKDNIYPCFYPFTLKDQSTTDPKDTLFLYDPHHQFDTSQDPLEILNLYQQDLSGFIIALKNIFSIQRDVQLFIPFLDLTVHQDSKHISHVSLSKLYNLYVAVCHSRKISIHSLPPLKICVIPTCRPFLQHYSELCQLSLREFDAMKSNPYANKYVSFKFNDRGSLQDPIVLDELESTDSIVLAPSEEIHQPKATAVEASPGDSMVHSTDHASTCSDSEDSLVLHDNLSDKDLDHESSVEDEQEPLEEDLEFVSGPIMIDGQDEQNQLVIEQDATDCENGDAVDSEISDSGDSIQLSPDSLQNQTILFDPGETSPSRKRKQGLLFHFFLIFLDFTDSLDVNEEYTSD